MRPPEQALWRELRLLRAHGFHIRRQAPCHGYFLDFVCFNRRVVVELDGESHSSPEHQQHDAVRDAVLARDGFIIMRFSNAELGNNLDGVVETVRQALEAAAPHPARLRRSTLPTEGEG